MGLAMSWMAIEGLDRADVHDRLKLLPTGQVGDFLKGDIAAQELPDGWILIIFRGLLHPLTSDRMLKHFSDGCRILVCRIEEHVNFSAAEAWKDGVRLWSIEHEGDTDVPDLEVKGHPPEAYAILENGARESQQLDPEVDHLFDVPLRLAASIAGFKHDESPMSEFDLLTWQQPAKPKWCLW
jgi:hypothetical protein